jgi:diadenosine tetraphosphate (Ap4A) HIT family hydrolase
VIPKEHGVKFHDLSDETLADMLPVAKKVALALGIKDYNLLQNNGTVVPEFATDSRTHRAPSCRPRSFPRKDVRYSVLTYR